MERDYLKRVAGMETPKWKPGMSNEEYGEICYDYCQLRNSAKDLLVKSKNEEAREILSELIKKLGLEEASLFN